MLRRTFILTATAAAIALATPLASQAQDWPSQTIKLIVGFPGGSTPDMVARTIAAPLGKALGQTVVVENRPGAGGNIAADQVARATDNHTLGIVINGNLTSSQMLYKNLPYDPLKDFSYISLIATAPLVLVAPASAPSGAAFFKKAAEEGDKWNYGSVGVGSVSHLGMELLKTYAPGLKAVQIPYTGGNPAVITAIIGGQVEMGLMPSGVALPQVEAGKLKAIGVTSSTDSPLAPNVPSLSAAGIKDFNLEVWDALVGPANLPAEAQQRLSKEVMAIVHSDDIREKLLAQGWKAEGTTQAEMHERVEKEAKLLGDIIRSQNISLE